MQILAIFEVFNNGTVSNRDMPIVNRTNHVHIYNGFINAMAIQVLKIKAIKTITSARKIKPFFTIFKVNVSDFSAISSPFLYEIIPLIPETNKKPAAPTHEPIKIKKYHSQRLSG